jgi:hypothetical protein
MVLCFLLRFFSFFPKSGKRAVSQAEDEDAALVKRTILLRPRFLQCCLRCGMCGKGSRLLYRGIVVPLGCYRRSNLPRVAREPCASSCFCSSVAAYLSLDHDLHASVVGGGGCTACLGDGASLRVATVRCGCAGMLPWLSA